MEILNIGMCFFKNRDSGINCRYKYPPHGRTGGRPFGTSDPARSTRDLPNRSSALLTLLFASKSKSNDPVGMEYHHFGHQTSSRPPGQRPKIRRRSRSPVRRPVSHRTSPAGPTPEEARRTSTMVLHAYWVVLLTF